MLYKVTVSGVDAWEDANLQSYQHQGVGTNVMTGDREWQRLRSRLFRQDFIIVSLTSLF